MFRVLVERLGAVLGPQKAGLYSVFALIGIQVGIGIVMKASQTTQGKYAFSASASIAISELLKLVLSTTFFWREYQARSGNHFHTLPTVEDNSDENTFESTGFIYHAEALLKKYDGHFFSNSFWTACTQEVSREIHYGFGYLALFYALINNTIFVAYKLADPGTIAITRSGVTFITALVTTLSLKTSISSAQWVAIVIQVCGLIVSQSGGETGISYPLSVYLVLIFQTFLSALAGVYNQVLLKSNSASLHVQNMSLYASGVVINVFIYIVLRTIKADEPGFFTGYGNPGAVLIILSNVFIGLAITAVYKYADAVLKCLATAVATGILLYISPIWFGTQLNPLIFPGTIVVFLASWLYLKTATPETRDQSAIDASYSMSVMHPRPSKHQGLRIVIATILATIIVSFLNVSILMFPQQHAHEFKISSSHEYSSTIQSPFSKTLAMVRWNSRHPERMPLLEKYAPFFHTLHFSMPNYVEVPVSTHEFQNSTHDSYQNGLLAYIQVARTMQFLLDSPTDSPSSELTGILYFHFDAWIDPLAFSGENLNDIWMAYSRDIGGGRGPTFECMTDYHSSNWWPLGPQHNWQSRAILAMTALKELDTDYIFDPNEFCTGWSDIYYIPREYWSDYIFLAHFMAMYETFHEIAIPTIIHIIDQSRRRNPLRSVVYKIPDCYGGCCTPAVNMEDLLRYRCGHKLDYTGDENVTAAHYDRLDHDSTLLGDKSSPKWNTTHLYNSPNVEVGLSNALNKAPPDHPAAPMPQDWPVQEEVPVQEEGPNVE